MSQKSLDQSARTLITMFKGFGITLSPLQSFENLFREYHRFKVVGAVRMHELRSYVDDVAYALGRDDVKIIAPVLGKQAIEINVNKTLWKQERSEWPTLLNSPEYKQSGKLASPIGVTAMGTLQLIDLEQTPHVLVLSSFAYDRTMLMNTILCALIAKCAPSEVRLLLLDPMGVNFSAYRDVPHLLVEPLHDVKQSVMGIRWAFREMERRLQILKEAEVDSVEAYNEKCVREKQKAKKLARIVMVLPEIGESAALESIDLSVFLMPMLQLGQMVGMHLICGTANFEPRILRPSFVSSFQAIASFGDIPLELEQSVYGFSLADVGYCGDIYVKTTATQAAVGVRQSYLWAADIAKIVESVKASYPEEQVYQKKELKQATDFITDLYAEEETDELYEAARRVVLRAGKASTSHIQRVLRIGYARAAKLMDMLERKGVIGPADGSNPREVLE